MEGKDRREYAHWLELKVAELVGKAVAQALEMDKLANANSIIIDENAKLRRKYMELCSRHAELMKELANIRYYSLN